MNSVKRIWYDIDGVLAEFEQHFLKWFNLPLDHATSWEDPRFREHMWKVKNYDLFWETIPPIFDPKDLNLQVKGYCTARDCKNETILKWLKKHNFPSGALLNVGLKGTKGESLKYQCDIMLDDAVHNFEDCRNHGITCYLMTRPHNLYYDAGEFRVNNIHEFLEKIK